MTFLKRLFGGAAQPPARVSAPDAAGRGGPVRIFAGLFVASTQAIEAWDIDTHLTPGEWPAMEFKHLDTVMMGTIESIVTGVPYDAIDQDELHNLVREGAEEGPWISRLREPLVAALADLDSSRVADVAAAWADTDEFRVFRSSEKASHSLIEALTAAIGEMAALARVSQERGEPMFLMMGL